MSKIEDIKKNFDRLYTKDKSFILIENRQFIMKVNGNLFCCTGAGQEGCFLTGKLEAADPVFLDKANAILKKEVEDVLVIKAQLNKTN